MAVVRVKRHCDEEPVDALILTCKRSKTDGDHLTSLFKFATTVPNQEENVSKHIKKAFSSLKEKSSFKTHNLTNITEKLRAEHKLLSQNSRLKVVNCFRALHENDDEGSPDSSNNKSLTVVEIESQPPIASEASKTPSSAEADAEEATNKYVYDIYYAPDCDLDDKMIIDPISCHPLDDLVFEDYSNDAYAVEEDSDDSNDENNWRNDYPDEDPDSIEEHDMKMACQMGELNISETNSLSSDGGEEELVYGVDDPDCSSGVAGDEDYYGYDYDAFKKRVTQDLDSDDSEYSDNQELKIKDLYYH